ncbi:GNAT family N-acetyltransferase [Agrococcus sp. SL85]|uniref:GNAT family N-acetyltransferase n=1 Tax=Agrococcus sp. SL85 TaxID=2995141 RepID=UPI00226D0F4C|nr:GNAT family N-acetyltransferase [Agrococcus sp. SL85]WAC67488.1 GNAT family N-acetyltransferase [Agrococcus sp. SL85]
MTAPTLRALRRSDAAAMVGVLADPALYEATGGEPPTLAALTAQYDMQERGISPAGDERWINELVLVSGEPVGYVQATVPIAGGAAEIAWVIGVPWQRRGLATRAGALLLERLRAEGVERVRAHILPGHVPSERVAARLGLVLTGEVVDGEQRWETQLGA